MSGFQPIGIIASTIVQRVAGSEGYQPAECEVDRAIAGLSLIVEGAANANHNAEIAAVRAFHADRLYAALKLIRPEMMHSVRCGDGRFTRDQCRAVDDAIAAASGVPQGLREAAE